MASYTAPVFSQEGGVVVTFGITEEFAHTSNPGLDTPAGASETIARTKLRFGVVTETRTDRLAFSAGGFVEAGKGRKTGLVNPTAELTYSRLGATSTFELSMFYRGRDVDTLDFVTSTDDLTGATVVTSVLGSGTQKRRGAQVHYEFGLDSPFGGSISLASTDTEYSGTIDPDLVGNRRDTLRVSLRFALSNVTDLTADGYVSRLREVGAAEMRTREFSLGLRHALPNGSFGINATSNHASTGSRQSLKFSRSVDLPAGEISAWIGASNRYAGGAAMIGGLDWQYEHPNGTLSVHLDNRLVGNERDAETRVSQVLIGLEQQLAPRLAGQFSLGLQDSRETFTGVRGETATIRAGMRYELTPDWGIEFGATHRLRKETGASRAKSTGVYFSVSRDFEYRP